MSVTGFQEDLFAEWQGKKFFIAHHSLYDGDGYLVILSDYIFWVQHHQELLDWCDVYGGVVTGMTVMFDCQQNLTAFVLRWA